MHASTPDFIHFSLPSNDDRATREALHAILVTHSALQRTTALRRALVHVLAVLGGLFAGCAFFPDAASESTRQILLWIWAACLLGAVTSATVEWQLREDEERLLARNQVFDDANESEGR